ncbi:MAG: cupin domain-containing protein [Candidatus Zixiibacteriota bacterium]
MESNKDKYYVHPDSVLRFSPMDGVETALLTGMSGESMMLALTTIQPGYEVPEHKHPQEQIGIVQAGKARMKIGGKERVIEKGEVCIFPSNVPHSAKALGDKPFVMLDIFHPVREDFIAMAKKQNS